MAHAPKGRSTAGSGSGTGVDHHIGNAIRDRWRRARDVRRSGHETPAPPGAGTAAGAPGAAPVPHAGPGASAPHRPARRVRSPACGRPAWRRAGPGALRQLRVTARAHAHRHPQQRREVADDARARSAGRVVDDEHLPDGRISLLPGRQRRDGAGHRRRCRPAAGAPRARRPPTPRSTRRRRSRRSTAPASRTGLPRTRPRRAGRPAAAPPARRPRARDAAGPRASRCASRYPSRTRTAAPPTGRGAGRPRAPAGRSPAPRKRHRPSSRASTASAARPSSPARTGAGTRACGSAPSTAATHATSSAPSRRPPPNQRRTGLPRQTDALSRNAELWLQVEPELAKPAATPGRHREQRRGRDGAGGDAAPAHPPSSASARVSGCSARRAAVTAPRPGTTACEASWQHAVRVLGLAVRLARRPRPRRPAPPGSGWPAPAG